MSSPTRREVEAAYHDPDRAVAALHAHGWSFPDDVFALEAAYHDPDREVIILDGDGWERLRHLMVPRHRLTEDEPVEEVGPGALGRERTDDAPPTGLREFSREFDPIRGHYWVEEEDD